MSRGEVSGAEVVANTVLDKLLPEPAVMQSGNQIELLCSGQGFFPSLLKEIANAKYEIKIETYIFANDAIGVEVRRALCDAAARGVDVRLVLDGFGGKEGVVAHLAALEQAGVKVRVFRPEGVWFRPSPKRLRRMHRKLSVFDHQVAFVGGINVIDDLNNAQERQELVDAELRMDERDERLPPVLKQHEPRLNAALLAGAIGPRYDFAVRLTGPVVHDVWNATEWLWWQIGPGGRVTDTLKADWWRDRRDQFNEILAQASQRKPIAHQGNSKVQLVLRDNFRFRRSIEKAYLKAIGQADRELVLSNAYFIPGRKIRKAITMAARRGVKVRLLLQGQVEYHFQHHATQALYSKLLRCGVEIYEYKKAFLHAKVAVVDHRWATVGSSNLDPLSFLLAREANVVVEDREFASNLVTELKRAMANDATRVLREAHAQRPLRQRVYSWLCYGLLRVAVFMWGMSGRY